MIQKVIFILIFTIISGFCLADVYSSDLDFSTAWQRTLAYDPSLEIADEEIGIKQGEMIQAGLRPNPLIDIEIENIAGTGPFQGWDAAEKTYSLWQTFELGGKRRARKRYSKSQAGIAYLDLHIKKQDLLYELKSRFIEVYMSQEKVKLAQERLAVAEKTLNIIEAQVQAGKVSPIQRKRTSVIVKTAQVNKREALSQFIQAKRKLSSMWGSLIPDFESVIFFPFQYSSPLPLDQLVPTLFHTPDFARTNQEIIAATKNLKLQRANRIPDLTVRAGYRTFNETNDQALVVEAQIPLPIFNQNQGNIQKARLEIQQAYSKQEDIIRNLKQRIAIAHDQLTAAFDEATLIKEGILAEAIEAFTLTQKGYLKGKLQYLDLLDAQNTLFDTQEQYLNVLNVLHVKQAEIERLTSEYHCRSLP